ncbi:MAG: membrane protein insertion efficiency factor YidD [Patescibacteria group bacterium]
MKYLILKLIKLYQRSISKVVVKINPSHGCRFYPSCSVYFYQSIEKYGVAKGILMGTKRILRCNPFNHGGVDMLK